MKYTKESLAFICGENAYNQTGTEVCLASDLLYMLSREKELLEALEFLLNAADTEPGMDIYKAHKEQARNIINKAKGE